MKAVVLYGPRQLEVREVQRPAVPPGWVLIRTSLVGICGTDKAFYTGSYPLFKTPLIPGHEAIGVVEDGEPALIGETVVPEINFPCFKCRYCREGLYTHCPHKRTLGIDFDGAMAEYFIAPAHAVHVFKGDERLGIYVEPLAAVLRALSIRPIRPIERAAVIGAGTIAYLTIQALKRLLNVKVDLIARRESKKADRLKPHVDSVIYIGEAEASSYDVVFEVSGSPEAINEAIRIVRPRGVIHLKSTPGAPGQVNLTIAVVKEVEIVCSRCGTFKEFELAIELLTKGVIQPPEPRTFKLNEAKDAFEEAVRGYEFKIALMP